MQSSIDKSKNSAGPGLKWLLLRARYKIFYTHTDYCLLTSWSLYLVNLQKSFLNKQISPTTIIHHQLTFHMYNGDSRDAQVFKFQVLLIYGKQFKLLLGWLANSEKIILASQTVHGNI